MVRFWLNISKNMYYIVESLNEVWYIKVFLFFVCGYNEVGKKK